MRTLPAVILPVRRSGATWKLTSHPSLKSRSEQLCSSLKWKKKRPLVAPAHSTNPYDGHSFCTYPISRRSPSPPPPPPPLPPPPSLAAGAESASAGSGPLAGGGGKPGGSPVSSAAAWAAAAANPSSPSPRPAPRFGTMPTGRTTLVRLSVARRNSTTAPKGRRPQASSRSPPPKFTCTSAGVAASAASPEPPRTESRRTATALAAASARSALNAIGPRNQFSTCVSPSLRVGVAVRPRRRVEGFPTRNIAWQKRFADMWWHSSTMTCPNERSRAASYPSPPPPLVLASPAREMIDCNIATTTVFPRTSAESRWRRPTGVPGRNTAHRSSHCVRRNSLCTITSVRTPRLAINRSAHTVFPPPQYIERMHPPFSEYLRRHASYADCCSGVRLPVKETVPVPATGSGGAEGDEPSIS
mmetsp:Transcript_10413/g.34251  ORF Transcript_10413/g.34251 Transcript_10413/m.34251 type:complete len:415 (-) Transcript_10413:147-1391(-)